ncbi:MAG TPA: hypothetical protein DER67_06950 [Novosphingobium sp.]|nr:hypothetical protein [Novosphingobium sp.]
MQLDGYPPKYAISSSNASFKVMFGIREWEVGMLRATTAYRVRSGGNGLIECVPQITDNSISGPLDFLTRLPNDDRLEECRNEFSAKAILYRDDLVSWVTQDLTDCGVEVSNLLISPATKFLGAIK